MAQSKTASLADIRRVSALSILYYNQKRRGKRSGADASGEIGRAEALRAHLCRQKVPVYLSANRL